MNILITGNMGYIGPSVVNHLRTNHPDAKLIGYDTGYFASQLTNVHLLPECYLDRQYFADVRNVTEPILKDVDAIIYLAAISNDPIGNKYEEVTLDINYRSAVALAIKAKAAGVRSFVFASSCSTYGFAEEKAMTETSPLNPLTAYAKSKVYAERELESLASGDFRITCLRFATACGMSERLRLDLVLNDFVASAVASGRITILSDGTPWRPLIHIKDMARAIDWGIERSLGAGGPFLVVNAGTNEWNYQVRDLAEAVARVIPGTEVSINRDAQPDKRSYRVNFDLFRTLAPQHQPQYDLDTTVQELREGLEAMTFREQNFRNTNFMRLKIIDSLRERGLLDEKLRWTFHSRS
ncbi:MAG: SDR family oxidoreductase [Desulfobacterales bacterium]